MSSRSGGFGRQSQLQRRAQARSCSRTASSESALRRPVAGRVALEMVRTFHFASTTVILPATPRALTPRSYIDSAKDGGTTNSPRLQGFIW